MLAMRGGGEAFAAVGAVVSGGGSVAAGVKDRPSADATPAAVKAPIRTRTRAVTSDDAVLGGR
jgi:hypothetical protein